MKSRIVLIFILFSLLWSALVLRAAVVQIWPNPKLAQLQKKQFATKIKIKARRGAIYDRFGKELAITVASSSLFADPALIEKPKELSRILAKRFQMDSKQIHKKLATKGRRFVWLNRHISSEDAAWIRSLKQRGLGMVEEPKRVYPNGSLLSQVLGWVGAEGQGLEGLELLQDQDLKGSVQHLVLPKDARGRPLLEDARLLTQVPDGADLHLTIDSELQFILESELMESVRLNEAESAIGIIMDAKTNEILAMASVPTYNLNDANRVSREQRRNRSIADAIEPGSTLKPFVVAAALKEGILKPSTKYDCEGGRLRVGKRWIKEAHDPHKFGILSVNEILSMSSNVGMVKIAFDLGADKLRKGLMDFGFGEKTGVDLPGESAGILAGLPWYPHHLGNISFGHGMAVTPIQVATAYAALANGGLLKRPILVKSKVSAVDGARTEYESPEIRRVLTQAEAATMTLMLTGATAPQSTGFRARIPGFPVAGKTGTAQKVDLVNGGYKSKEYISSFAGFAPAHDPRFVIYVAVDNPQKQFYGSQVAAPLFARLAQYAVRKAGLTPILISEQNVLPEGMVATKSVESLLRKKALQDIRVELASEKGKVPDLKGLSLRDLLAQMKGSDLKFDIKGQGVVIATEPSAGEDLPRSRKIKVRLSP